MIGDLNGRYDVAIVGFGPVGAVLANILGAAGLSVVIFEREASIVSIPRAVFLDSEIMRVIQGIGLAEDLEPLLCPSAGAQFVGPDGEVFMRREASREEGPQSWYGFYSFHQPSLETVLRKGLERYSNVTLKLRHDVYAVNETADDVILGVEDTSKGSLSTIAARFVVGCDGARSLIRRLIGSEHDDLGLHEPWVVSDFKLTGPRTALPDLSTQFCDPERPVTYVRVSEERCRFELKLGPDDDSGMAVQPGVIWERVKQWIDPGNAVLVRAASYTFHSLIANRWRRDRLIIAGDAAHQTPPFLGQGLCAGIRDVANLGWKLVAVLHGRAPEALLETYGPERIPHIRVFIELAVRVGKILAARSAAEMAELSRRLDHTNGSALVYPTPRLGDGFFKKEGGVVSQQPRLEDGRRLDDALGTGFAMVVTKEFAATLPSSFSTQMQELDIKLMIATGAVSQWLSGLDALYVVLRPDRYVYTHGRSFQALVEAIADIRKEWSATVPIAMS